MNSSCVMNNDDLRKYIINYLSVRCTNCNYLYSKNICYICYPKNNKQLFYWDHMKSYMIKKYK